MASSLARAGRFIYMTEVEDRDGRLRRHTQMQTMNSHRAMFGFKLCASGQTNVYAYIMFNFALDL